MTNLTNYENFPLSICGLENFAVLTIRGIRQIRGSNFSHPSARALSSPIKSGKQFVENRQICLRPLQPGQFLALTPTDFVVLKRFRFSLGNFTKKSTQPNPHHTIRPIHHRIETITYLHYDPQFLRKLSHQRRPGILAVLYFPTGKFP